MFFLGDPVFNYYLLLPTPLLLLVYTLAADAVLLKRSKSERALLSPIPVRNSSLVQKQPSADPVLNRGKKQPSRELVLEKSFYIKSEVLEPGDHSPQPVEKEEKEVKEVKKVEKTKIKNLINQTEKVKWQNNQN